MNNNYQADAVESIPELSTLTSQGYPTNGSPELGIPATQPGAAWFYAVTSEIVTAIEKLGGTPSRDNIDQLADTLLAKFALKADLKSPVLTGDVTVPDPVQDHNPVTKAYLVDLLKRMSNVPTGAVLAHAGSSIPDGFLLCNGALISRTTYSELFTAIGTLYGAGDGTFKLPDLRDRFIEGAGTNALATYLEAGLPNITGTTQTSDDLSTNGGAFNVVGPFGTTNSAIAYFQLVNEYQVSFDASRSSPIYGKSSTVQPKSLCLNYIIKF